jgi:hypothetical protein
MSCGGNQSSIHHQTPSQIWEMQIVKF